MPTYTQETYSILETLQGTAGGDVELTNSVLQITGCPAIPYSGISRSIYGTTTIVVTNAELAQVSTVTPTASSPAVGTIYSITITQKLANGITVQVPLKYTVQATTDDATTVCNAWRLILAKTNLEITASGTTTLILTADSGAPVFVVSENSSSIAVGTGGTVGEYSVGVANSSGVLNGKTGFVANNTYSTIPFVFQNTDTVSGEDARIGVYKHTLYVDDGSGTNYTNFANALNWALEGVTGASGTIATEAFEVGS
jgi:hypothetical protein